MLPKIREIPNRSKDLRILVFSGLSNFKLNSKILPITAHPLVSQVFLVRRKLYPSSKNLKVYNPPTLFAANAIVGDLFRLLYGFYICLRYRPDFIMGIYMRYHGVYAWALGKLFRIPVIQNIVGSDFETWSSHRFFKPLLKQAHHVVVRGDEIKNKFSIELNMPLEKFTYIPNLFDMKKLPLPNVTGPFPIDLICMASATKIKNLYFLLNLVSMISRSIPIKLALIGDGPLLVDLKREATHLQIESHVDFYGDIPNKQIYPLLQQSKFFILTSFAEGLPMAMLEALAMGVPVLVPNIGSVSTHAENLRNAVIFDGWDIDTWSHQVTTLLKSEEEFRELKSHALRFREENHESFSIEGILAQWEKILKLG